VSPWHLLVDSTGLKLCGAGEWLVEKHGTKTRRSWRKLHIGTDGNTGEIVATALTTNDVDDASQIGRLLGQVEAPVASFTGDGAYDQDSVYRTVTERDPEAAVVVPPRATAVPSETAETEPTQRDRHLQCIAEKGRIGWQKVSGYTKRSRVETAIGRYKQVVGEELRLRKDRRRTTEFAVAVHALTACLSSDVRSSSGSNEFGRGWGCCAPLVDRCNNATNAVHPAMAIRSRTAPTQPRRSQQGRGKQRAAPCGILPSPGRNSRPCLRNQSFRASGLSLITAAIVHWNTVYLDRAVRQLRAQGAAVSDDLLAHVAHLGWEHIGLTGDYVWTDANPAAPFRPLPEVRSMFQPLAA
jgi:Transposase DDE domain/Tn3 transposase DDE domain